MDPLLFRVYQMQVVYSCKAVLLGFEDIGSEDRDRLWYGVQNFIIGAGNLSKTLWGTGGTKEEADRRYEARKPLRDSLSVTDDSPLRRVKIRNDYEHLDERIEEWWNTSPNHYWVAEAVASREELGGGAALGDKDIMRWIDTTTMNVIFWGNELNIATVLAEVRRILPIAKQQTGVPRL